MPPKEDYMSHLRQVDFYRIFVHYIFPILIVGSIFTCVFCFCNPLLSTCFKRNRDNKRRTRASSSSQFNEVQYSPTSRWDSSSSSSSSSHSHELYKYRNNQPKERTDQTFGRDEEMRLTTQGDTAHYYRSFPVSTAAVEVNASHQHSGNGVPLHCEAVSAKSSPMNPDHRPVIYI